MDTFMYILALGLLLTSLLFVRYVLLDVVVEPTKKQRVYRCAVCNDPDPTDELRKLSRFSRKKRYHDSCFKAMLELKGIKTPVSVLPVYISRHRGK